MDNYKIKEDRIKESVSDYLDRYGLSIGVPVSILLDSESKEHVISIGTSIMLNKLGTDTRPGSFVRAVLDNNLSESFNRADSINRQCLGFYTTMMYSMRIDI